MPRRRSEPAARRGQGGFTIVEFAVASFLALVVALAMGTVFLVVQSSFRTGSRKVVAQQEATLLAQVVSRQVRLGDAVYVYRLPDRVTAHPSGNGLAVLGPTGSPIMRLEYDSAAAALEDSLGGRLSAATVRNLQFSIDPLRPRTVVFRFAADDEYGNLIDVESSATLRN